MAISKEEQIRRYADKQLTWLAQHREESAGRAALAQLRRGVGRAPGELPQLWGSFLSGLPEEMYGFRGTPSHEEWAIYTALTLYALHQQGQSRCMNEENVSLGAAAGKLIGSDDPAAEHRIWKRVCSAAQADDMTELAYRLRQFISLLKAAGVGLDYVKLSGDLYDFQFPERADRVRLRWGEDFFRRKKESNNEDNKEDDLK